MAEIMAELKDYLHIDKGGKSRYSSIEEFKNDLDLEFIKKFMSFIFYWDKCVY